MAKYVGGDGCHIGFDDTEVNEDESSDKVSLPEEARHVEEKAKDTAGCIATTESKMPPKTRNSASSASSSSSSSSSDSSSSSSRYLGQH